MTDPDSRLAKLELNARGHRHDPQLERFADLFHTDRAAYDRLPRAIKSQLDIYSDMRDHYRRAVEAGAITDDRGPSAA